MKTFRCHRGASNAQLYTELFARAERGMVANDVYFRKITLINNLSSLKKNISGASPQMLSANAGGICCTRNGQLLRSCGLLF